MVASPPQPRDWTRTMSFAQLEAPAAKEPSLALSVQAYRDEIARRAQADMLAEVERDMEAVRVRCRTFAGFVREAWKIIEPGTALKWNWHLDAMCDHLQAISEGRMHPRLIINVPPGSSKSTIVTVLWQAWEWGPLGRPHLRYVSTSFELGNVKRDTSKSRDLIASEWYQALWPETALKTEAVLSFSNAAKGTRLGVAFASVTGKRGDRLVVDDPHSLKGAESETQRDGAVQLFIEGGLNRVNDWATSAIVIVMQRVHERDLTGVLLARDFGFTHLMIPMEFEPARRCVTFRRLSPALAGPPAPFWSDPRTTDKEPMDRVRVPTAQILELHKIGDYAYAGQYQQRPAPREGGMFLVDEIGTVEVAPGGGTVVGGWDIAGSKRKTSPYTVRVLMKRVGGDIYVLDVQRRRTNPTELNKMVDTVCHDDAKDYPDMLSSLPQDPGAAGKVVKWGWSELLMGLVVKITPESGDKETRADPFASQVGMGRVFMVKGDWNDEYKEELRNFPAGRYKDQVDASSRAFGELVGGVSEPENAGPEIIDASDEVISLPGYDDDDDPWAPLDE